MENEEHRSARIFGALGETMKNEMVEVEDAAVFRVHPLEKVKIGDKERTKTNRIMIAEFQKNQLVGIIVDEVTQVMNAAEAEVLPPPPTIASVGGKYIESIVKQDERITVMLNIDKIFSDEEQEGLKHVASMDIGGEIAESPDS